MARPPSTAPRAEARRPRGNALIEFVLLLPFLAMLVLGAIDWGWYFTVREIAINAVRQGARVGSAAPDPDTAAPNARAAGLTYLQNSLGINRAPTATLTWCEDANGVAAPYRCVAVSLTEFPVVPSRPRSTLSGLTWTHAPTELSVRAEMRLEVQP